VNFFNTRPKVFLHSLRSLASRRKILPFYNWKDWVPRRVVQASVRRAIIDARARAIQSPIDRLRFLRDQMGPAWADESGSRWSVFSSWDVPAHRIWLLASLIVFFTLVFVPAYKLSLAAPSPASLSTAVILPPPVALSSEAPSDAGVWIVDRKNDGETYSNGLRVENRYAVDNQPRGRYKGYARDQLDAAKTEWMGNPAGIVFHTTESHQIPLQAGQNRILQRIGMAVLLQVQQNRSYHFLIDRFGRVFRVVKESDIAFHSGNSVWADEKHVYVGLNTSFLGVAFETETKPGDDITSANAAQIHAARVLTAMLRSKYSIPSSNCVTHAQVSVNPANRLIGYHTDWAANFPFLELGLRDNYAVPPASIAIFGFGYDPYYVQSTGTRLLPGLLDAENQVRARAVRLGLPVRRYKALLQLKYLQITATNRMETGTHDKQEKDNVKQ
jgi:N-acetylmuramoyl-L-alanine amidase